MKLPAIDLNLRRNEVAHRVISEKLREAILSGKLMAGTELPSTGDLALLWKTSKFTVHTALRALVKEGLLQRNHGSATYVRKQPLALTRVGISYDAPRIWFDEEQAFIRSVKGVSSCFLLFPED
jgi:DNA-binding FadR family transcriptional regulator